ncbi:MAG: hypothetical protein MGU50_00820 [Trichodesmium sp. MAG_R02]|nr:hypothetical protein [Trichodesmium sp. MAG_R02]
MQTSLLWSTKMKTAVKPESHELGNKKLTNSELQKHLIILAKKTQDRVWRSVVSAVATTAIFCREVA